MKNEDIFKAVGGISDELIDDSALTGGTPGASDSTKPARGKRTRVIASVCALAACAALVLGITRPWESGGLPADENPAVNPASTPADATPVNGVMVPAPPYEGVYIPPAPMPEAPEPGTSADMVAFFIYNGRLYTQTGQYADASLKGHYICTVTGNIDEWSGADEYVEGASSVAGDVYSVTGYNPGFRLCMADGDGTVQFYDSMSDIAFITGADLFGTCLHVENCVGAYYVTDSDWENLAPDEAARHSLSAESLKPFIALLMASPMQDWSESGENRDIYSYGYAEAHLYLELADGTAVPLRLFGNGCVKYDGSAARVCVYMPGAIFDAVFEACA